MAKLTSQEQARLEMLLARAHQSVFHLTQLFSARDDYDSYDDFNQILQFLAERLESELKYGKRLRTRKSVRTYPSDTLN